MLVKFAGIHEDVRSNHCHSKVQTQHINQLVKRLVTTTTDRA